MRNKTSYGKYIAAAIVLILLLGLAAAALVYNGVIKPNGFASRSYPVHGVDVASYQGEIDWEILAAQDIQFAFIKATEGSSFIDPYFQTNYEQVVQTDLRIGAYHFFSYDSSGQTQAENFISVVPKTEDMLPPVADVEFYGDKEQNLPDPEQVAIDLTVFLEEVEQYYERKPIIYATEKSYRLYIAGNYDDYDIWIRNILTTPTLSDNRDWIFWQYTNRGRLNGYNGPEKYIDINVYNGTREEFLNY